MSYKPNVAGSTKYGGMISGISWENILTELNLH